MSSPITTISGSIANGETTSGALFLNGAMLLEVSLPSAYDGTAFTILTSADGATFQTMQKDGSDKTYTVAASKNVNVAGDTIIANYIKIVAGTTQTGATAFTVTAIVL